MLTIAYIELCNEDGETELTYTKVRLGLLSPEEIERGKALLPSIPPEMLDSLNMWI